LKANLQRLAWVALAGVALYQVYFVRELLAALILLGVVFAAFATLVLLLNGLHWMFGRAFAGVEALAGENFSKKPFHRLRSMTAR